VLDHEGGGAQDERRVRPLMDIDHDGQGTVTAHMRYARGARVTPYDTNGTSLPAE